MVLIIRNNRIKSSRHSRLKNISIGDKNRRHSTKNDLDNNHESSSSSSIMGEAQVLGYLLIFSVAMFTLPFAAFFGVKHIMEEEFHAERFMTNCVSVCAAVLIVNIIIAGYAYLGFQEPDDPPVTPSESSITKDDLDKKDE